METAEMSVGEFIFRVLFMYFAKVLIIMVLWNYLMPSFGLHELSFLQSMATATLGECIFQPWGIATRKLA